MSSSSNRFSFRTRLSNSKNKKDTPLNRGVNIPKSEQTAHILAEVGPRLNRLVLEANTPIKALPGNVKEDFHVLVGYINALFDTSEYPDFYRAIQDVFSSVKNPIPGTVGGYFKGCVESVAIAGSVGCAPTCAGAAPLPAMGNVSNFCSYNVILASFSNSSGYQFSKLSAAADEEVSHTALVYVDAVNLSEFKGFNDREKAYLVQNYGVESIQLFSYIPGNSMGYIPLTEGFVPLSEIKSRIDIIPSMSLPSGSRDAAIAANSDNIDGVSNDQTANIILICLLVIIVVYVGWKVWSNAKRNAMY